MKMVIASLEITCQIITSGGKYGLDTTINAMKAILEAAGGRIRELRAGKGWSQEAFADECGINRSHMGEVERGETNVTFATLFYITQKLEISIAALFQGIG
jgi:DNA-binding XRE family transcriptional regulator